MNLDLYHAPCTKINLKSIVELNVKDKTIKPKTIKPLGEKLENYRDLKFGKNSLNITSKVTNYTRKKVRYHQKS